MISSKFHSFTLDLRRRPRSPGPGVANSGGLGGIIGEHWSLRRRRKKEGGGGQQSSTTMGRMMKMGGTTRMVANANNSNNNNDIRPQQDDDGIPRPMAFPPPKATKRENFANNRSPGSADAGSTTGGGKGEAETRSLDRHIFWQHRASVKSHQEGGKGGATGPGRGKENGRDFDSPGVALLDPCSSSSASSVQHSAAQLASAPHRLANFLSRRLKRTKSYPKLQNGISREELHEQKQGGSSGEGGQREQLLRASLGPNALRTDQQQRTQPLSLYLPGGGQIDEQQLKASRSFESLALFGHAAHAYLQKSPSESDHRLLLCPIPSQSQQFAQQPGLQSSLICLENGGGGRGGCWMDSSSSSSLRGRMQQQQQLNRDQVRRVKNSLSVWVLEAKGVQPKRRFFCEISLDQVVKARTSAKAMADGICFWGEQFDFQQLPPSQLLCIDLFREAEPVKKRRSGKSSHEDLQNLIGLVRIPVAELSGRQPTEKWYPVSSGDGQPAVAANGSADGPPSLRLKARYQSVHVLPLRAYAPLRKFLRANFLPLCAGFEPILGVKAKEDFANSLVRILHIERKAPEALAELAMAEVLGQENDHLLFRGNSLATKAVEAYMKLVATDYLQMALGDFVRQLLCSESSCEVDPLRLSSSSSSGSGPSSAQLERNRQQLMRQVEMGWRRILACQDFFPYPLRLLFAGLRQRLEQTGRAELADNLLSSSIFLRFLCPAILSPSLFGLVSEFPTGQAARNLTLIAKSLQTLANFTRFGGKEGYMEFMNIFVEREWRNMHQFLSQISAPCPRPYSQAGELQSKAVDANIDLGKELSLLNSYLRENWTSQARDQHHKGGRKQDDGEAMGELWGVLVAISAWDICDPEEEGENGGREDGRRGMEDEEEEGDGMSHNGHNPPSDYENNAVMVGGGGGGRESEERKQQQQPMAAARRAILPPQPPIPNGQCPPPPALPLIPPPPFSPSAAAHLHSSDDYVLSSALAKLRTCQEGGGSSIVHLYDETPPQRQPQVHLYDEVAATGNGASRALTSGVVMAQRGVASHETQRRVVQRGGLRQHGGRMVVGGGADEADDESESGREEEAGEETAAGQSTPRGSSSGSFRHQRRAPRKRSGCQVNGAQNHRQPIGGGDHPEQHQQQQVGAVHFDSSSASAISNGRPRTATTNGGVMPIPSSGYQSQLNSSGSYSSSSNSSSPIDTTENSLMGGGGGIHSQHPFMMNGAGAGQHTNPAPMAIANPLCHHQTQSTGSSSCSSSSAYSSLSPNQPAQNGACLQQKPPKVTSTVGQQIGQQWPSPRERAQTTTAGGGGLLSDGFIRGAAESPMNWPTKQKPRPRLNPSCWSIPGSSGPVQARQAFVACNPGDPLGAFIRYPAAPSSAGPLAQKFPTAAELQHWPGQQPPTTTTTMGMGTNGGGGLLYPSASIELADGINGRGGGQFYRRESGNNQQRMAPIATGQQNGGEFDLIEAQRRQIAELSRENAALRMELDNVRTISQCSLPCEQTTASESI